jgi:hypothetical protein
MTLEEYNSYMQGLATDAGDKSGEPTIHIIKQIVKAKTPLIRKTFTKAKHHAKRRF